MKPIPGLRCVIVPNGEQLNRPRPPTIQHEGDQSHVEIITLSNHALVCTTAVPCPENTAALYVSLNTFRGLGVLISSAKCHYKFYMVIWYTKSNFNVTTTCTVWHHGCSGRSEFFLEMYYGGSDIKNCERSKNISERGPLVAWNRTQCIWAAVWIKTLPSHCWDTRPTAHTISLCSPALCYA